MFTADVEEVDGRTASVAAHHGTVSLSDLLLTPDKTRELAAALLRAADEAEGREPFVVPVGWFACADDAEAGAEYPWQPYIQFGVGSCPLPIWFRTEEECNEVIRTQLMGRGFLPGEGK